LTLFHLGSIGYPENLERKKSHRSNPQGGCCSSIFFSQFHIPIFLSWPSSNEITPLQESRIGLAVGKLRTHETKAISDLSKEIVKQWKAAVDKAKAANGGGAQTPSAGVFSSHSSVVAT